MKVALGPFGGADPNPERLPAQRAPLWIRLLVHLFLVAVAALLGFTIALAHFDRSVCKGGDCELGSLYAMGGAILGVLAGVATAALYELVRFSRGKLTPWT